MQVGNDGYDRTIIRRQPLQSMRGRMALAFGKELAPELVLPVVASSRLKRGMVGVHHRAEPNVLAVSREESR